MTPDEIVDLLVDSFVAPWKESNAMLVKAISEADEAAPTDEAALTAREMLLSAGRLEADSVEFRASFARILARRD